MGGIVIAVHGEPKVGKTWFAASGPKPVLLIDAEAGGTEYVPGRKVAWDYRNYAPPAADGSWDAAIATIRSTADFDAVMAHQGRGWPFRSVSLDSLSELQVRARRELAPTGDMDMQLWGKLLARMESIVHRLRDLTILDEMCESVTMVCGTRMDDQGKMQPGLQGASARMVAYAVDLMLYLYLSPSQTELGAVDRLGLTAPKPHAAAGNRLGGALPELVLDPDISAIVAALNSGNDHGGQT